ncbi:MAG TPA: hypothetical protein DF712_17585 [Balneola sp.]|nr:hypothetical protein [Balneola sp.]
MPVVKKQYDLNRIRKSYTLLRTRKKVVSTGTIVEAGTLNWTNESSEKTYTFTQSYSSAPNVVVTPSSVTNGDVNLYITTISKDSVTIEPSGVWSGTAYIQVVASS